MRSRKSRGDPYGVNNAFTTAVTADELYPRAITRDTLRTIKDCIDRNVARLREGDIREVEMDSHG